jgi:hypothetical protein
MGNPKVVKTTVDTIIVIPPQTFIPLLAPKGSIKTGNFFRHRHPIRE